MLRRLVLTVVVLDRAVALRGNGAVGTWRTHKHPTLGVQLGWLDRLVP